MTRTTTRRVVSLWLPRLATDRLGRRPAPGPNGSSPSLTPGPAPAEPTAGAPRVIVAVEGGTLRLTAVDLTAQAQGLFPGQSLADARALEPGVAVADADPAGDLAALGRFAAWCARYTPWVAVDGLEASSAGALWLDITGCAHLFARDTADKGNAGEDALLADLLGRFVAAGYSARAGLADTPGAAWAAARFAGAASGRCIIPSGHQQDVLAALPVAALRLPAETVAGLDRLGLRRIGDLLALPRAGLARRFGAALTRRLDQALGHSPEPISPHPPAPSWRVSTGFAESLGEPAAVLAAAQRLTEALCARLAAAERGARRLELALYRVGGLGAGRIDTVTAGTSRASRDPTHLLRLLAERLERLPEPAYASEQAIEFMALRAVASEALPAAQTSSMDASAAGGLAQLIDRLSARLGSANVVRFEARDSHLPERAQAAVPALQAAVKGAVAATPGPCPRPPRLLPRPEPVAAIAPVPDDPPVLLRWRRQTHRIVRAEGPERLAPEWWRAPSALGGNTRDYYRVEDAEGRRFWLYRDGLYGGTGGADSGTPPRWYLHGFFG